MYGLNIHPFFKHIWASLQVSNSSSFRAGLDWFRSSYLKVRSWCWISGIELNDSLVLLQLRIYALWRLSKKILCLLVVSYLATNISSAIILGRKFSVITGVCACSPHIQPSSIFLLVSTSCSDTKCRRCDLSCNGYSKNIFSILDPTSDFRDPSMHIGNHSGGANIQQNIVLIAK